MKRGRSLLCRWRLKGTGTSSCLTGRMLPAFGPLASWLRGFSTSTPNISPPSSRSGTCPYPTPGSARNGPPPSSDRLPQSSAPRSSHTAHRSAPASAWSPSSTLQSSTQIHDRSPTSCTALSTRTWTCSRMESRKPSSTYPTNFAATKMARWCCKLWGIWFHMESCLSKCCGNFSSLRHSLQIPRK